MGNVSRRDLLKTGLLAPAAVAVAQGMGPMGLAMQASGETHEPLPAAAATPETSMPGAGRERLLLDFGWRFHFGHANDPAKDFGYGTGGSGTSRRREALCPPARWRSTTATGARWICRTTGRSSCRSRTIRRWQSKGFYPLGRNYPATSVGWYRRVFELPAEDAGKRITHRVRRRVPRDDGGLQRLLHRAPQRRIRSVQFRSDRLRESRRQECAAGARGCHGERRLVLRGRGDLPARVAGEDASGACEEVGHVCEGRRCARARPALSIRTEVAITTATARRRCA